MKNINSRIRPPYLQHVFRQMNEMALVKAKASELIKHSLEKGLSNEAILREILRTTLPRNYGIGKGKIVSPEDGMSRQCDIIIYDALNCPCLFIDENMNQVLPIEGVYAVVEVKTKLTKSTMKIGFEEIRSVKELVKFPEDVSTNELITIIPPLGYMVCYEDKRSLKASFENYMALNKQHKRSYSSLSYSKKSPGYAHHTHQNFLVEWIVIINKGILHYMYDGFPAMYAAGLDSLGCFIAGLLLHLQQMKLKVPDPLDYYGNVTIQYDNITKTRNGYLSVQEARRKRFPNLFKKGNRTGICPEEE